MHPELARNEQTASLSARHQQALTLWLRWHDAYERLTSVMFESNQDQQRLEELMDQLDQLRFQAAQLSRELLDMPAD